MRKLVLLAAGAAAMAFASNAYAAVEIRASPSFVQPAENVLLDTDLVAGDNTLRGTTNQSNSKVLFQSTSDALASPPQGQAEITPIGGGALNGLNQLTFSLENGSTFTSAEFNILAAIGGQVTISAFGAGGGLISSMTANPLVSFVGINGQNYFGLLADAATPISSISIAANGGTQIASIGQFRVGGVSNGVPSAVPEPATWAMMLVGFGALGFGLRRRKPANSLRIRLT